MLFLDRIRSACLPFKESILHERVGRIYRLVRVDPFDISFAANYKPNNYSQVENDLCKMLHEEKKTGLETLLDQNTFCAQGGDRYGNMGDPFVVKINGPTGKSPVYQVGIDTVRSNADPGIFLNIYPYVQWIRLITFLSKK